MDGQTVVQPAGAELNGVPNGGMFPPGANQYPCWSQGGSQQHRPEMPSTSNGAPIQFQDPSPNFYNASGMAPPNSAPPSVGYFNQQQPYFANMQGMPNQRPPGTPDFQPPPSYNAQMGRPTPMNSVQRPPFAQQPPMISRGMSNPQLVSRNSYVFTSEMLNVATQDVKQGRYPGLVQWHQARQMSHPTPIMNNMMDNGQRNSPSFPSAQQPNRSLKRKNTAQSEHNPSPSPQSMQNVDFKQPMSNQNPQDIKQELNVADENNPLKKMEIMASFSNEPPTKNMKTEMSNGKSKEEKMAKLDEIQRSLQQPPQFHPSMRFNGMPGPYPSNQMPPQYMNGQNFMPQGYNPQMPSNGIAGTMPNGMPPSSDPNQMSQYHGPMNGGPMPQNGFQGHMNSPRFMGPSMGQGMMGMPTNDRPMPGVPYQPGMEMNMARGQNPQEQYAWNQNMPQPLTNLDSRVPNQKMQYYGNGQPPMGGPMPPPASTT